MNKPIPIPPFSPFPEITTERLVLRRMTAIDIPEILDLRSSEQVMRFIDRPRSKTLSDAQAYIDQVDASIQRGDGIMWAMALRTRPDRLIGCIGYWRIIREHYRAEVGYMLHPDHWRKGFTREALARLIDYAFGEMNLHSIEAHINPGNQASGQLLESFGFVREAYFREDYFFNGSFHDTAIYSLLDEYRKK